MMECAIVARIRLAVMRTLTDCKPVIAFSRPDYYSLVIVKSDSGINSVMDLKGKKIAMADIGSTSGHLGPCQVLKENVLNPLKDIQIIHTTKEIAWESLKKGDVAAWAYSGTNVYKMRDRDTASSPGSFKIIARGPDLPNDVLVAGAHVDKKIVDLVVKTIAENSDTLIKEIIKGDDNQKYKGMKFLPGIKDEDYNYVRAMYRTIGQERFTKFVGN